ncbi:MAG TPA: glycine--tRNA ligase [Candidatus Paceibacterota bacterium]|nr:glycine--tRNA ligase [Candidatus Paceibacterota bacterium]
MSVSLDQIVSLAKRRGFVFPGSEIYGGLAGTFDYGPLGVALKNNLKAIWWRMFVESRDDMYGMDAAQIMPARVWEASGHTETFNDPLVSDEKTGERFRLDHVLEAAGIDPTGMSLEAMWQALTDKGLKTPSGNAYAQPMTFNLLFPVTMGASKDSATLAYLRGETAQGMFVNFKNIIDAYHPKLPFGMGQIGKAFRNEIAPREFVFRLRELEQMEVEYFVAPEAWEASFEEWLSIMRAYATEIGLPLEKLHEKEIGDEDRAHYSKRTIDFEYEFPTGTKELWGLAYRTDYDLSRHGEYSGVPLTYLDEEKKEKLVPHVIEPSLGLERTLLAVLVSAYDEDELGGEKRVVLRLSPKVAPVKAMVSPLLKNKPELVEKAKEVRKELQKVHPAIAWDDNGNIGKRYRRQDEIGTPFSITIDFDTLGETPELKDTVTLRHRDTGAQERLTVAEVAERIRAAIS